MTDRCKLDVERSLKLPGETPVPRDMGVPPMSPAKRAI